MKKAIFTLAIGDNPMYKAALETFQIYADKVGADLIVSEQLHYHIDIKNPQYSASPAWPEKLYTSELLKQYDRVLYLDADILVTPHAEDIFEKYTDLDTVYMFDEGRHLNRDLAISQINAALGNVDSWPSIDGQQSYYNFGMFLVSKQCKLFEVASLVGMQKVCNSVKFYDQTYINYIIQKNNIPNQSVEAKFNRMEFLGQDEYKQASFIHYAGRGYRVKCPSREIRYIGDYCELYADRLSTAQQQQSKLNAWNLFIKNLSSKSHIPQGLLQLVCKPTIGKKWL